MTDNTILNEISQSAIDSFLKKESRIALDSAISQALRSFKIHEVISMLREHAQHLEDHS